ncbi:MAG: hypothetical protein QNK37_36590 [Acidobacteriota bacterium]|nr:hypothetical protein [Acidobacteriota bacterium]
MKPCPNNRPSLADQVLDMVKREHDGTLHRGRPAKGRHDAQLNRIIELIDEGNL